ncbi:MAG TPA: response regulator [Roseimicrobium sp.]|nr:response regulator [Roseimicrobium sp.]
MSSPGNPNARQEPPEPTRPDLRERDQRMESLKFLAGRIAHDFNNYLAPILGYVTLIKEEVAGNASALEYAGSLEMSGRRSERAIETILLACRPQRRYRPETTDLSKLLQDEVTRWKAALPATAKIDVGSNLDSCVVHIDTTQWRSVIQQLLGNAHFALATGGHLQIELHPVRLDPEQQSALGIAGSEFFELSISDNGFGMPGNVVRHAFDPFYTTRPKGSALGLGLSIVHAIVRLHGGQVTLESEENRGTTVRIFLPTGALPVQEPLNQENTPAAAAPPHQSRGRKVLVVDDDPMVREVIRACLQRAGYDLHLARDGAEGLKLFNQLGDEIALIISDVTMPNLNGVEMYRKIRETNATIPVLMISGDADAKVESGLAQLGANRPPLIKKPFAVKGLLEEVRKRLG